MMGMGPGPHDALCVQLLAQEEACAVLVIVCGPRDARERAVISVAGHEAPGMREALAEVLQEIAAQMEGH